MMRRATFALKVRGRTLLLGPRTVVMGVLNVTPDSFSDGGLYLDPDKAVAHALRMIECGADWIDVGGESTRPGSKPVSADEEQARVLPVIRALHRKIPAIPISIDTTKSLVAEEAVKAGASIINDVSGLRLDPRLAEVARSYRTGLILMHLRGRPETMQTRPFARDVWRSIRAGLYRSVKRARQAGIRRSQIIIDPGLGFGKTRRQNFEILARLDRLREFHLPILIGSSRKSFVQAVARGEGLSSRGSAHKGPGASKLWPLVGDIMGRSSEASSANARILQSGDAAAVVAAVLGGAHVVRAHDVEALMPAIRVADALLEALR